MRGRRLTIARPALFAVAALAGVLAVPRAASGQVLFFGTWTLNLDRSTYSPGPPPVKRSTFRMEPWGDGVQVVYDMVRPRGGITHLEWRGAFDGRDYPLTGVEDIIVTNAYRRTDDRSYEIIQKVNGEIVATAKATISADGRTLTTVTTTKNPSGDATSTTIYERQ